MKICIIGTGYVGLVAGACLADMGNDVICVDNSTEKITMLENGDIPIYEPGLDTIVSRNVKKGRLTFSLDLTTAVQQSLVCFIAVGTPPGEDGSADLKHVIEVAESIGKAIADSDYKIIINKSTVPVGTADRVRETISKFTSSEFDVVSNPEFLKEGDAIADFMRPSRIIIGTESKKAQDILIELFEPYNRLGKPILLMSTHSAELSKYAANAMLATRITFMNEIANLCEKVGADVDDVRQSLATDPRIGNKFLFAGVGYGGSCFPKDVTALIRTANKENNELQVLTAVDKANQSQKRIILEKINQYFSGNLAKKKIAVWGLAFKPNTNDMREAPSIEIVNGLLAADATVTVYDPVAIPEAKHIFSDRVDYAADCYAALESADALVIVTEWNEFRYPDFERMIDLMQTPVIFDGRNLYNHDMLKEYKIDAYYSIGRSVLKK